MSGRTLFLSNVFSVLCQVERCFYVTCFFCSNLRLPTVSNFATVVTTIGEGFIKHFWRVNFISHFFSRLISLTDLNPKIKLSVLFPKIQNFQDIYRKFTRFFRIFQEISRIFWILQDFSRFSRFSEIFRNFQEYQKCLKFFFQDLFRILGIPKIFNTKIWILLNSLKYPMLNFNDTRKETQ